MIRNELLMELLERQADWFLDGVVGAAPRRLVSDADEAERTVRERLLNPPPHTDAELREGSCFGPQGGLV